MDFLIKTQCVIIDQLYDKFSISKLVFSEIVNWSVFKRESQKWAYPIVIIIIKGTFPTSSEKCKFFPGKTKRSTYMHLV